MRRLPLILALGCFAAHAQIQLAGRVVDETGGGVGGARIEVATDAGATPPVVAISDPAGNFHLALPSPGGYSLRVSREGFYVFSTTSQALPEASRQLIVTLNHQQEFPEKVEVKASPPLIDPQQPAARQELNNTEIQAVPYAAPQDYRNALQLLNGVIPDNSGRFHFNGGAVSQTNYTLDGFNISNPVTGQLDTRLNIDTVQTMEALTSRFSADNGRGSAGVLNINSRMGDDHFRFNWTNFIPSISTESGLHINKLSPRIEFSGPIKKGRVWFQNGLDLYYTDDIVHGLADRQNQTHSLTTSDLTHIRADLTPGNVLTAGFLWNLMNQTNLGLSFLNPAPTTTDSRQTTYMSTLRDQQYFHGGALLDFGLADTRGYLRILPQGDALYQITPFGATGNFYSGMVRHFYRQQATGNLFLPEQRWHGSHQLKFGFDFEREAFHEKRLLHDYEVLDTAMAITRFVTFQGPPFERGQNLESAQYVQDHWNPRKDLTFELGLRLEWNEIVRDLEVAPRVAATWAPSWLKETKFSAGWGIYYDAIRTELLANRSDLLSLSTFYLPNGIVAGPVATSFFVNDRALSTPRYTLASFSIERKLPFNFYGRAGYLRRATNNAFAFTAPNPIAAPDVYDGAQYALGNTRRDRYRAFDLTLRRTFLNRYEWFLGYTRSSAWTSAAVDYNLENPVFAAQSAGYLPWDAPDRVHMWGWAPLPNRSLPQMFRFLTNNTTAAYLIEYRTGFPFNVVDQSGFLLGNPGSRRFPDYFSINLHFERQFHAIHALWAWRVGADNITNNSNPNFVNNIFGGPQFLTYARGQARAVTMRIRLISRGK